MCASCHQGGRPVPLGGIDLALSTAVSGESSKNLVNVIFEGLPAVDEVRRPIMPGFAPVLTDDQAADLIGYIRSTLGRSPPWTDVPASIRSTRAQQRSIARPAAPVLP
jgi:mono/diheme cytochrome c family protein